MNRDDPAVTVADGLPERIGRYRVTGRVGKGAMGVVYSAYDEVMGREVAIKVLMADLESDPTMRARFYREAQAAGRLLHRNIITVFDVGEDDGRAFIVMELLKGRTLPDFIRNAPAVQLEQKLDLMAQVCEGLQAAHAQGIFHRDIKPGNLFVLVDGTLKILDFGVARLASSTLTGTGAVIGTPDYMAPEQARGQEVDARSDLFSSAAVFYFMLAGKNAFTASSLPGVLRKVQFEDPPPLDERDAPRGLWRVVAKGLAKQPSDRYQSAMEMFLDLVKFRRAYDAETRDIAVAALRRVREIEALVDERRQLGESLGIEDRHRQPIVVNLLRDEAPAFFEQSPDAVLMVPFARRQIESLGAELDAEHGRLLRSVEPLRAANAALESGERLLADGDVERALARFEEAGHIVPTAERLRLAGARYYQLRAERAAREQTARDQRTKTPPDAGRDTNLEPGGQTVKSATAVVQPAAVPSPRHDITLDQERVERGHEPTTQVRADAHATPRPGPAVDAKTPLQPPRAESATWLNPATWLRDRFGWRPGVASAALIAAAALSMAVLAGAGYGLFFAGGRSSPPSPPLGGDGKADDSVVQPAANTPSAPLSSPQQPASPAGAVLQNRDEPAAPGMVQGPAEKRASGRAAEKSAPPRGRSGAAETARTRLRERYAQAASALAAGDFAGAIAGFEAVLAEQPNYEDAADLLAVARRRGAQQTARREYEAGAQAATNGNDILALQHFEQALTLDGTLTDAQRAIANLREKLRADGEDAYRRAKQYDALGRTAEAIAMYDKAVQMLPADHPLRANARERLDALRAIK